MSDFGFWFAVGVLLMWLGLVGFGIWTVWQIVVAWFASQTPESDK